MPLRALWYGAFSSFFLHLTVILHCTKRTQNKCKIGHWRLLVLIKKSDNVDTWFMYLECPRLLPIFLKQLDRKINRHEIDWRSLVWNCYQNRCSQKVLFDCCQQSLNCFLYSPIKFIMGEWGTHTKFNFFFCLFEVN